MTSESGAARQRNETSAASAIEVGPPRAWSPPARRRPGASRAARAGRPARGRRSRRPAWAGWRVLRSRCRARRCRRRRDAERLGGLRDALDRLGQLPADLGLLRVAEVQAVGKPERLAAGAGDVARGAEHGQGAGAERIALASRRPVERDGEAAVRRVRRRTAASSPGRRTVREPTSWSYCSYPRPRVDDRVGARSSPLRAGRRSTS